MASFAQNIMSRTKINTNTLVAALLYLERLKKSYPRCRGSSGSGYRLLLSAIILAAKYLYDDTFDNAAWATVSCGMFNLKQVNHMEMELLNFLSFSLFIKMEEWNLFCGYLEMHINNHFSYK